MRTLLVTAVFALSLTAAAAAQDGTETGSLHSQPSASGREPMAAPPVESMNCEQMMAELMVAGQQMNAQMDPEFAVEAQAMQQETQQAQQQAAGSVAAGIGMSLACSIPGVGMACMAAQQAQAGRAQQQAQRNMERMDAQMDRLNASMEGIDQQRMMALSQRYEEQNCQTPQ